jgi:opacity protein-like surface antigen
MKKLTCSCLMLLLFYSSTVLLAQTNAFDIALVGGPNRSWLRGNSFLEQYNGPAFNYALGLSAQYNFPGFFSICTGITSELKGSKSDITVVDSKGVELGKAKLKNNLAYLILPVMAKFSFGRNVKLVLGCGGYGGYLMGASSKYTGPGRPEGYIMKTDDSFQKWDFGASLSAGVSIPLKEKISLAVEVRNNTGLYNIANDHLYMSGPVKTNSTNLLFGLSYRLGDRKS